MTVEDLASARMHGGRGCRAHRTKTSSEAFGKQEQHGRQVIDVASEHRRLEMGTAVNTPLYSGGTREIFSR